jgi:hypothetical protein
MSSSSSSSGHAYGRAYDVEDSENSDDDDDEYSESGDVVGHFLSEVAGTDGGDASWGEFCGPCCTGANNKDDTTEEVEVDGEAKSSAAPSFDGHQQTLMLNTDNVKKRRVVKKVSITTTQGPPKVISPADVAQLYRGLRHHGRNSDECCVKARTRGTNCIEFAFTDPQSKVEDVARGMAFLSASLEETLNMSKPEKKSLIQARLRSLWNGALSARAPGETKVPQYFPYGVINGTESITLCQNSFAAIYDVTPHSVKKLVNNILTGKADVNPEKKQNYRNNSFEHVSYLDVRRIFEDEGDISIGT